MGAAEELLTAAHASLRTVAVTGTNGKTTTTSMIDEIVAAAGEPTARITTLGAWVCGERIAGSSPTDEFQRTVETAIARGVKTIALEVTSKALAGGFARRWPPHVAVFTNLSRDHLDMHGTPEAYLASKAQLFLALGDRGVAVINADDPSAELIRSVVPHAATVRAFSPGGQAADLAAEQIACRARGTTVSLRRSPLAGLLGFRLELAVTGAVHAGNALAAALAATALGYSPEAIRTGLSRFAGVPGRFQIVGERPLVVIDYAHTPDGLAGTLATARRLVAPGGQLWCVFGCGGERDRGKRPQMGAIAHAAADRVVLTSDNPRREPPEAIAAEIRAGARGDGAHWIEELDRRAAIGAAIAAAAGTDVVVIAGKGHEAEQEIAGERHPFSDEQVAREAISARASQ